MSFHRGEPRSSLDRTTTALDTAGVRFTQRGDHVQALCPVHPDQHPSLSIDYKASDARVLFNCQASCETDDILAAIGMTWAELYDDWEPPEVYAERRREERARGVATKRTVRTPRSKTSSVPAPKGRLPKRLCEPTLRALGPWKITSTYDYVDAQGTVVQQEVRHERPVEITSVDGRIESKTEKRFTQRWPNDSDGWVDKTPAGFDAVLYGMPAVTEWVAAGRPIWVCEGVKDVERFLEMGEAATTNPSGAGNFKAHQADSLAGANVIVVVDHDQAGYRRALKLQKLLADRVATLRFALPRTEGKHQDASDHFDAGHGLNFAEATLAELIALEQTAVAEDSADAGEVALAEATARYDQMADADGAEAKTELSAVQRWAAETVKHLARASEAHLPNAAKDELQQRLQAARDRAAQSTTGAYGLAGIDLPDHVEQLLVAAARTNPVDEDDDADLDVDELAIEEDQDQGHTAQVLSLNVPSTLPAPSERIPMSRGTWGYELGGEGRRARGVYTLVDSRWILVADLPYVNAQIIERDGMGRRTGVQWLASTTKDEPGQIIAWDDLNTARWANMLNLRLSREQKAKEAAAMAFELLGAQAQERERTPRIIDGQVDISLPDTLPGGYLATSDLGREDALNIWGEILREVGKSPRMALVMGAAAVAPYVAALGRQTHIVSLYGDAGNGKTVTLQVAGAIWGTTTGSNGKPLQGGNSVVRPWNSTTLGVPRFLGQLGVLPAFFDEAGQASASTPREWGKAIYDICEGAQRMGSEMRGLGVRITMPWHGILISAGNGRLTDGLGAGRYAGIGRRVIDLETPLTIDAEHAEQLASLLPDAQGHIGHEIINRHNAETVKALIDNAAQVLGMPDGGNERTIAKHLHAHLAGAMMLDEIAGAEGALYFAALEAAVDYLEEWAPPEHDADRILDALEDAIGREPAMWPEAADYLEHKRPIKAWGDGNEALDTQRLPQHGINRTLSGITRVDAANGDQTVWVFAHYWRALCEELGADSAVACRELNARGVLRRTDSSKRAHEWTTKVRVTGSKMYELQFPMPSKGANGDAFFDSNPDSESHSSPSEAPNNSIVESPEPGLFEEPAQEPSVPGESSGRSGSVPGDVPGTKVPLTSSVPGVPGKTEKRSHVGAHVGAHVYAMDHETVNNDTPSTSPGDQVEDLAASERPLCIVCGTPASQLVDGQPLHLGECAQRLDEQKATKPVPETTTSEAVKEADPTPMLAETTASPRRGRGDRFAAPAAVVDADGLHVPGEAVRPFPQLRHFGDLAQLTGRDQLRLGWGGGEDRMPDPGQIWLTESALERLGLPTSMPLPEKALTKKQRAAASLKMFSALDEHPMVAGAIEDGWQFGQGGHLAVWTRIWHRELLPAGAFIVSMPWHHIEDVPLFKGEPGPAELAGRLKLFAQHVGVAYRLTTAATGLDLIDHHRPPRRSIDDDLGVSRNRVALVRSTSAELPPWRQKTSDARFTGLEQDFSWWRPFESLPESEQALPYVHGYDRNASYLAPWTSIELGVEDLQHRVGDDAKWDGRETPGYYLVDGWEWESWGLPDPGSAAGARVGKGRMWVTVHTLRQLAAHGIEPNVHESYTWGVTARYLEGPGKALSLARKTLTTTPGDAQDSQAVLAAVKLLYSSTVGKLAERDHRQDFHLWRPDWRDHVIGATKTAILRTIDAAGERSGRYPVAVDHDAIFYASESADPTEGWPGDPAKLGPNLGSWKPIGSADFTTWGPTHLTKRSGRWHYSEAVTELHTEGEES